jgi:DNA-binding NarL/FixJ family response regulator
MTGVQAMIELKAKGYNIPFVLISSDASEADAYIRQGAMAFVAKVDMGSDLASAVVSAYLGHRYLSRSAVTGANGQDRLHSPLNLDNWILDQIGLSGS